MMISNRRSRRSLRRRKKSARTLLLLLAVTAFVLLALFYILRLPREAEKLVYPLSYQSTIDRYAEEYDLEPARVAAVIFCESSFVSDAVSYAGARGLMQIMPETGKWIAKKLDEPAYTDDSLFDPETNIRYGCWYLNYLDGRFDGDLTKATAAYHAGGGTVDKWLEDETLSSDGVTLEAIPDANKETKAYVARVSQMVEKYRSIYEENKDT